MDGTLDDDENPFSLLNFFLSFTKKPLCSTDGVNHMCSTLNDKLMSDLMKMICQRTQKS